MGSRIACEGTRSGAMGASRRRRTLSRVPVSSGSASATTAWRSPSVSMRKGNSRACLAKLIGTSLTRSCETSSGLSRIWYGSSSCAARALRICSSVHALFETRTSPRRPPRSAWTASASSIFSRVTTPWATRTSPTARPARSTTGLGRRSLVVTTRESIRHSTFGSGLLFRCRHLLAGLAPLGLLVRLGGGLLRARSRSSLLRRPLGSRRGRWRPRARRSDARGLVAPARGRDDAFVGRPVSAILEARPLAVDAALHAHERASLAVVVDVGDVGVLLAIETTHEFGSLRHLALEDPPVVALVPDDV